MPGRLRRKREQYRFYTKSVNLVKNIIIVDDLDLVCLFLFELNDLFKNNYPSRASGTGSPMERH